MSQGVLLVRAESENQPLALMLGERGFNVFSHSLVDIEAVPHDENELNELASAHWHGIIVVSPNATRFFQRALKAHTLTWPRAQKHYFTVGPGTAKALQAEIKEAITWPAANYDSEALLALSDLQQVQDEKWLIITGKNGRRQVESTLRERGAKVSVIEIYQRVPKSTADALLTSDTTTQVQRVVVTSREQAQLLCSMLNDEGLSEWARNCHWVVPSDRVAQVLEACDIATSQIHFAASAMPEDLVAALTRIKSTMKTEENKPAPDAEPLNKREFKEPKSKSGRAWAVLMFVLLTLCVVTLAFGGWWLWQQQDAIQAKNNEEIAQVRATLNAAQQRDAEFERRLQARLENRMLEEVEQAETEQQTQFSSLRERQEAQTARIREQMAQQDRELARLSQRLRETEARNSHQWLAHEAYERVTSATQRLAIDGSPAAALQLLQQAEELLSEQPERFQTIRMQLQSDISFIASLPELDLSGTIVTLQSLQQQIPTLSIRSTDTSGDEEQGAEVSTEASDWRDNLSKVWEAFSRDLIRIQKTADLPLRLDQEQRLSLNSRLEMQLQLAQQAVIRADQELFTIALTESYRLINEFFDTQQADVQNVLRILSSLQEVSIRTNYPTSLISRAMLREYISALETAPIRTEE
ncbi:MAG: uroporphyrinogen-III synthase HemD [Idiomarinaceae bacterium HL-53]|nr:MAG: uroporphyrinogen-III synthase HemD [Idiomarinaceae bacterium HL-53]CUS47887.1 conserved protein HemX [Idiomarinaceae bacterium HL-53]